MPHHYRIGPMRINETANAVGSDRHALQNGFISVTPLSMDQTNNFAVDFDPSTDSDKP